MKFRNVLAGACLILAMTVFGNHANAQAATNPNGINCPFGHLTDGCWGAMAGHIPRGGLISTTQGYSVNHPPQWNVAGVDYPIGLDATLTLTPWSSVTVVGTSIDLANHVIRCDTANANVVLTNIDFTVTNADSTIGAGVYIPSGGCASLKINHSKFGNQSAIGGTTGCTSTAGQIIQDQNAATVTVAFSDFDMTNCLMGNVSGSGALLYLEGPLTFQYNYVYHWASRVTAFQNEAGKINTSYNYMEDAPYQVTHLNVQEFDGTNNATQVWDLYNTLYFKKKHTSNGELFQYYGNTSGGTVSNISLSHNIMIATDPDTTGTCQTNNDCPVSYAVHGNCYSPTLPAGTCDSANLTSLGTNAKNQNNWYDIRGMYGPTYGDSFPATGGFGWTCANTGGTVNSNLVDSSVVACP